ncbi:MAG: putative Ig domain-containing protein [Methanosarcinaceae archaeon]
MTVLLAFTSTADATEMQNPGTIDGKLAIGPDDTLTIKSGGTPILAGDLIIDNPGTIVAISPGRNNITPGENFTVDVLIYPSISIIGAQFDLLFDSSMATANSVTEGNLFNQDGAGTIFNSGTINNSEGTVTDIYGSILGKSNVSSEGVMATISMTAGSDTGMAELKLSNVIVSDSSLRAVPITINNSTVLIDTVPLLNSIGSKSVSEANPLNFTIYASDADGDDLTYSAAGLPEGANIDPATGGFAWTPAPGQSGIYTVTFEVSDGYLNDSEDVLITVNPPNNVPVIDSFEPENGSSFNEKEEINISVSAFDLDGQFLNYIIRINGVTCSTDPSYIWQTDYSSSGEHTVEVTVSDGIDQVTEQHTIYINDYHPEWDIVEDGEVNILDIATVCQKIGTTTTEPYPRWDVNQDGKVNILDLSIVGFHFGEIIE